MLRRQFGREYKIETVRPVKERGVSVAQPARDLDIHENMLRKWVRELDADPAQLFAGNGQMKPDQLEIERLRGEVTKLKAERNILKKGPQPTLRGSTIQSGRWHSSETMGISHRASMPRCLIPAFDGAIFSSVWRDALWDKFFMGASKRQRRSVERYKIVKRA